MSENVDYSGVAEFERRLRKSHPAAFDEFVELNKARHEFNIAEQFLDRSMNKSPEEFEAAEQYKRQAKRNLTVVQKAWNAAKGKL